VNKIRLKQSDFYKIWLAKKNFPLISVSRILRNKQNQAEPNKINSPSHNKFGNEIENVS